MNADILLVSAIILLGVMIFAWEGVRRLRSHLVGQPGYRLVNVTFWVITVVVLAQAQSVISATLIVGDRNGTLDVRIALFMLAQVVETAAVLWAFWTLKRLEGPK